MKNTEPIFSGHESIALPRCAQVDWISLIKPRILTTSINEDHGTASLDLAIEVAEYFKLGASAAWKIAQQTGRAVSKWRSVAKHMAINDAEIDRMASAFERGDLAKAANGS